MIPFEFRNELWCQKTRVKALSCGVICVILRLAVLIQYRSVTDTHTHTHTDRHTTTAYTAFSKASRGKNVKEVKHFLGISKYFRRLINNYSKRSAPLRELMTKDKVFEWNDRQEASFQDISNALCSPQSSATRIEIS